MLRIVIGLLIVIAGALIVIKAEWFYQNFGAIPWAEAHLGTEGGSRLMYKLIGIGACLIGFMLMTNLLGVLFMTIFGRLFTGFAPK